MAVVFPAPLNLYFPLTGASALSATAVIEWTGRAKIQSTADGILQITNNAVTGLSRVTFGPATSSFPAIGSGNGNTLQCLLGDGSGYTNVEAVAYYASRGTAVPAGGSTAIGFFATSTAGLGVYFGSGVPTISAAQGSLYIRTDGSSTTTRAYLNTNGSTGWTAITTVA